MKRRITLAQSPVQTQDGDGVKLLRLFPAGDIDQIDPFLLFDHFGSDNVDDFIAGFPMHPHRGIETVTYMLEGRIKHSDSTGRSGVIEAGDVQWMSAGRGILHEEMPERAQGHLSGFQLWVNLSAQEKMKPAEYQEYKAEQITTFTHNGHQIKLLSGEMLDHQGVVSGVSTAPIYADITLSPGELVLDLPEEHHVFLFVFEGSISVHADAANTGPINSPQLLVLSSGATLHMSSTVGGRLMLAGAAKIDEPVERWGPFVMNTREEIEQTLQELRSGSFPPE